ncbi:MAG: hypothetical protein JSW58_08530 [Candidatus Latescibacterota bacterium]|nr:MAG: hypothetical protein JSW58_08530 [Candidatus Latescibacterota bacterium]
MSNELPEPVYAWAIDVHDSTGAVVETIDEIETEEEALKRLKEIEVDSEHELDCEMYEYCWGETWDGVEFIPDKSVRIVF